MKNGRLFCNSRYFQWLAEELDGRWLSISHLVGAQIAFFGFYNAMVINAERTACFFCEGLAGEEEEGISFIAGGSDGEQPAVGGPTPADGREEGGGGRFGKIFDRWAEAGCISRFWFALPAHGVRRIYCLVIALLECGLVLLSTDLLVELAMMIYSLSFVLVSSLRNDDVFTIYT